MSYRVDRFHMKLTNASGGILDINAMDKFTRVNDNHNISFLVLYINGFDNKNPYRNIKEFLSGDLSKIVYDYDYAFENNPIEHRVEEFTGYGINTDVTYIDSKIIENRANNSTDNHIYGTYVIRLYKINDAYLEAVNNSTNIDNIYEAIAELYESNTSEEVANE